MYQQSLLKHRVPCLPLNLSLWRPFFTTPPLPQSVSLKHLPGPPYDVNTITDLSSNDDFIINELVPYIITSKDLTLFSQVLKQSSTPSRIAYRVEDYVKTSLPKMKQWDSLSINQLFANFVFTYPKDRLLTLMDFIRDNNLDLHEEFLAPLLWKFTSIHYHAGISRIHSEITRNGLQTSIPLNTITISYLTRSLILAPAIKYFSYHLHNPDPEGKDQIMWEEMAIAYSREGDIPAAIYLINRMKEMNRTISIRTIHYLLQGGARLCQLDTCTRIVSFLETNGWLPSEDDTTKGHLLELYTTAGDAENSSKLFSDLMKNSSSIPSSTWSTIILTAKTERDIARFDNLIQTRKVPMDIQIYSAFVLAALNANALELARKYFIEALKHKDLSKNSRKFYHTTLLFHASNGNFEGVQKLYLTMRNDRKLTIESYYYLIEAFGRLGRTAEVLEVFTQLLKTRPRGTDQAMSAFISYFARQGAWDQINANTILLRENSLQGKKHL